MNHYSDCELIWVFNRTGGRCLYCGQEISFHAHQALGLPSPEQRLAGQPGYVQAGTRGAWVVDCFVSPERGGTDQIFNWVASCPACSRRKGSLLPWEFDPERFREGVLDPDNTALMSLMRDRGMELQDEDITVTEKQGVFYRPDEG
jgi:hypothetical protein